MGVSAAGSVPEPLAGTFMGPEEGPAPGEVLKIGPRKMDLI